MRSRAARQMADELADELLDLDKDSTDIAAASLRRLTRAPLSTAGHVQLFQRLRDQDPALTPALRWLEEHLASQGTTAEEMVRVEHQRQATMTVTVRNVITSMRQVSWFDWAQFVESVSLVDDVLRERGAFGEMDFATRDRYRNAIEEIARGSGLTEVDVARTAMEMAASATVGDDVEPAAVARRREPGYYLIADGRAALERVARTSKCPCRARLRRAFVRSAATRYLLTLAVVTALRPRRAAPALQATAASPPARSSSPSSPLGRRPIWRSRSSTGSSPRRSVPNRFPRSTSMTGCRRRCARSSWCRCCSPTRRRSKRTSAASRSTTSAIARATCGSRCCLTGSTPRPSRRPATTSCSPRRRRRSTGSTSVTGRHPGEAPGSCCSTASDAGTRPRAAGWAGSASAASSTS